MERVSTRGVFAVLAVGFLALILGAAADARIRTNPANHPKLIDKPLENSRYDTAKKCVNNVPKGMQAFQNWLSHSVRGSSWGIIRCESLGGGNMSLHSEGRAIDWHLDARDSGERRAAMNLIKTFMERDRNGNPSALARRMGVQGIIFDCKTWWAGQSGLGRYSYCFKDNGDKKDNLDPTAAHIDHIHLELNKPGAAKRTSFWRSPLA